LKNKAVILGANYYIGLSIARCLGRHGIPVTGVDYNETGTYAFKSKYMTEKLMAPDFKADPKAYVECLIDYAKKQDLKPVLFPCADPYVEVIDNHLADLKEYYHINMTQAGLFTDLMDKNKLHDIALDHGVLVPETLRVDDENFYDRVEKELGYPCIVKPSDSHAFVSVFRRKMFKVSSKEELQEAVEKSNSNKLEVIVQRIIPGFDDHMYTFDAHLDQNSKVTHYMTCNKNRQYPINFGASVFTKQVHVQDLYDIGAPFLEAVGFKGFAEIEFKKDALTGKYYLIEINVRTTNLNVLLEQVGINFPLVAYKELVGEDIGKNYLETTSGRTFVYGFEDALAIKGYLKTKQLTLGQVFKSHFTKKAYAIWSIDDPKPYFSYMAFLGGKVLKKIRRK